MNEPTYNTYYWEYPQIGTCKEPCDILRICILRVRAINDLLLKFDGERNGWVIGGSFITKDQDDFEFREVAFIHEDELEEDRFLDETQDAKQNNDQPTICAHGKLKRSKVETFFCVNAKGEKGNGCILETQGEVDSLIDGNPEEYDVTKIEMTRDQFEKLEEFQGF